MRLILCLLVLLVACSAPEPATEITPQSDSSDIEPGTDVVEISNFAYSPADITVQAGDTVLWVNRETVPHTATGKGFDSGRLYEGQKFSHTFSTPGEYEYGCRFHPAMAGVVRVV